MAAANKVFRVVQDPLDMPLMGSNTIQGPKNERRRRCAGTDSGRQLSWTIPVDSGWGALAGLLRWWPRWRMSWAIPKVLSMCLRHVPTWAGVPKVKKHCWTAEPNVGL